MANISAKKSLGQNFLKDENILRKIANSFDVTEKDLIIEIGPGMGALTKYLIQKSSDLICYEIDERLKDTLLSFSKENVQIIFDDFCGRIGGPCRPFPHCEVGPALEGVHRHPVYH